MQDSQQPQLKKRGDGRIFLRGKIFWCAFFANGQEHRETTKTDDAKKAEKYLRARIKKVHVHEENPDERFLTSKDRKRTVADLMGALKLNYELRNKGSLQNLSGIKRVKKDFGHIRALNLTAEQIAGYIRDRIEDGYAAATINRWTEVLRAGLVLAELPVPKIVKLDESGNVRSGFFTETEIRKVLASLPDDLTDFVLFAWLTGWRRKAVSRLQWSEHDGDSICLRAENAKNRTAQRIPLEGELLTLIERRSKARKVKNTDGTVSLSSLIFHREGKQIVEFRKAWQSACIAAGVGQLICEKCSQVTLTRECKQCQAEAKYHGKLFHDMRRSTAKNMTAAGVPQHVIMQTAGWKSPHVFRRYAIVAENDMRTALANTQEYLRAQAERENALSTGTITVQ
jgi:integrase